MSDVSSKVATVCLIDEQMAAATPEQRDALSAFREPRLGCVVIVERSDMALTTTYTVDGPSGVVEEFKRVAMAIARPGRAT